MGAPAKPRALFIGTPAFAVPALEALLEVAEVVGVVCQPDKPVGRAQTLTAPAVKTRALEASLPVVQPTKLRTGEFAQWVRDQNAEAVQRERQERAKVDVNKLQASRMQAAAQAGQQDKQKPMPLHVEKKVGRNDPCPCGSGKKYKQCHGKGI